MIVHDLIVAFVGVIAPTMYVGYRFAHGGIEEAQERVEMWKRISKRD